MGCSLTLRGAMSTPTRRRQRLRSSCTRCARTWRRSASTRRRLLWLLRLPSQLLLRRRQRLARPSPSCSLTLRPATSSDEKKAKVEEIIHKMRKDLANVGHAKEEAKVPVHKE